ncbi:hypothetical protein [Streptomyces sp. NPDC056660]|uniref:hypothetical protein n=1 Tax=Streptomyces sp. NPDC056660 TaxID=3345897 RepID=UPI003685435A
MRKKRIAAPGDDLDHWIDQIAPTPLTMLVATGDTVAPTDLALRAYERALEPKELVLIRRGHVDPYLDGFETRAADRPTRSASMLGSAWRCETTRRQTSICRQGSMP